MSKPEIRPMSDLECRLWRERGLTQAQLLALSSILARDDKGETQDHARWTPAIDVARKLIAERDELAEALREIIRIDDTGMVVIGWDAALNRARALLARIDGGKL